MVNPSKRMTTAIYNAKDFLKFLLACTPGFIWNHKITVGKTGQKATWKCADCLSQKFIKGYMKYGKLALPQTVCVALGRSFTLTGTQRVCLWGTIILIFPIFCLSCLFRLQAVLLRSTVESLSSDVMQIHEWINKRKAALSNSMGPMALEFVMPR